jgi:hypothetical protein
MLIKHCWNGEEIKKKSSKALDFLLTNGLGGYLSLSNKTASRYNGWFFTSSQFIGKKLFKIIEDIELLNKGEILEIKNNFWNIERVYKNNIEKFFLPNNYNSLVYELGNREGVIRLFLDAKESYDNQEFGRFYEIFEGKKNIIVIKCQNNQDIFYLAIKADNYSKIGEWVLRNYELDKKRNSKPFERYVYKALDLNNAQKIVFSVNFNKEATIKEAEEIFLKTEKLKKREEKRLKQLFKQNSFLFAENTISKEIRFAYLCAKNSLNSLVVLKQNIPIGIYAGLPWFFQFWSRDELISLNSLNRKIQKRILLKQFHNLDKIYNLDSLGWLFFRASKIIQNDKEINKLFFKFIDKFEILDADLTWMDTLSRSKGIDLYALKLASYKLAYQHSGNIKFLEKEKKLLKYTRDNFWNGKILADLPNNFIIRPNIFLVAYIYPELLSKKEWIICFENSLPKLWLDWGGIATVDKTKDLFIGQGTGENPKSYHNGDSWFWINNLAALVLTCVDKKKFRKYIEKILTASTNEILWNGVVGHHAEISSANKFISEGCWAQAWSSALYMELVDFLYGGV